MLPWGLNLHSSNQGANVDMLKDMSLPQLIVILIASIAVVIILVPNLDNPFKKK